jgi:hypothetical protein
MINWRSINNSILSRWNFIYADCQTLVRVQVSLALTDFIRDDPYGGDALDAVKEEARRRELDEFTMIIVSPAAIDQI